MVVRKTTKPTLYREWRQGEGWTAAGRQRQADISPVPGMEAAGCAEQCLAASSSGHGETSGSESAGEDPRGLSTGRFSLTLKHSLQSKAK
uniref:Uncharacterized protein n=1 Tax=Knipowitschia caucasica TaxID=637954 RepID=A0AAV2JLA5_KNICA